MIVETDSLVVVQAIRSKSVMISYFGKIMKACKSTLRELKDYRVSLMFVKRFANKVTYYLARHTSSVAERCKSVENAHSELMTVLLKDLQY